MNPSEALEHIERVVEVYADINPEIYEVVAVLRSVLELEHTSDINRVYSVLRQLEQASTDFALAIVGAYIPHPVTFPKETLGKLIPVLARARVLLGREGAVTISNNHTEKG